MSGLMWRQESAIASIIVPYNTLSFNGESRRMTTLTNTILNSSEGVETLTQLETLFIPIERHYAPLYQQTFEDIIRLYRCHCAVSGSRHRVLAFFVLLQQLPRGCSLEYVCEYLRENVSLIAAMLCAQSHTDNRLDLDPLRLVFHGTDTIWRLLQEYGNHGTTNQWLLKHILQAPTPSSICSSTQLHRYCVVKNLNKSSRFLRPEEKHLRSIIISGCKDSCIFICAPVEMVDISDCINCRIVVGACLGALHILRCERSEISSVTRSIQIIDCHNSKLFTLCLRRPIVAGVSFGLIVGPFNSVYAGQEKLLRQTSAAFALLLANDVDELNPQAQMWSRPLVLAVAGVAADNACIADIVRLVSADEFQLRPCPHLEPIDNIAARRILALPQEFVEALLRRQDRLKRVQTMLSGSQLSKVQQETLKTATQQAFKEWLENSGEITFIESLDIIEQCEI